MSEFSQITLNVNGRDALVTVKNLGGWQGNQVLRQVALSAVWADSGQDVTGDDWDYVYANVN